MHWDTTQAMAPAVTLVGGCLAEVWEASRLRGVDRTLAQAHGNLFCGQPLKDTHFSGKGSSKELSTQSSRQRGSNCGHRTP